jgi:hypothetical protein
MTYYGRWTYKYEIASEKGAAACLIIHETGPAGYPFAVLGSGWGREAFDLVAADNNEPPSRPRPPAAISGPSRSRPRPAFRSRTPSARSPRKTSSPG